MATLAATRKQPLADMARALTQLRIQMRELGLTVSVWDDGGKMMGRFLPCCQLCQTISDLGGPCAEACGKVGARVISEGRPVNARSAVGCCVVGTPVVERRRTLGAVVACYLPRELFADGPFARLCGYVGLDQRAAGSMGHGTTRHGAEEAADFLRVLGWLLAKQQALLTTQSELEGLSANLASTYEELSLLYAISGSMNINHQPREFLQKVCSEILEVMDISAAAGVMYRQAQGDREIVVAGELGIGTGQLQQLIAEQIEPLLAENQEPILDNSFVAETAATAMVHNILAVPLITDRQVQGTLVALNKRSGDFDSVDLKLFTSIAAQAAIFLEYSRLYFVMKDLLMGVLHALTASIDAKDPYTCGHSQRVALISKRLAEAVGLPPDKVQRVYLAGLLHDIGKIGVPESVLQKPGSLTDEEKTLAREHPATGARILSGIRQLDDVVTWIQTHHEHLDGSGYPRGLAGEEIPLEGRIIHLADCFDAMTSDRTYRGAMSLECVAEEIRRVADTQVDAQLAETLLSMDLDALLVEASGQAAAAGEKAKCGDSV